MQQNEFENLSYEVNKKGVAFITIDVKDRPVNVLTTGLYDDLHNVVSKLKNDEAAIGAVICSGKDSFFAGGDLKRIVNMYSRNRSPELALEESTHFTKALRKLELCGKPVAVAINGSAMGGGLELALACNFRACVDESKVVLGLPEVSVGLLPGGGGTQRLPRMIGLEAASDLILNSKILKPQEALDLGIIDCLCDRSELLQKAEEFVLGCDEPTRKWDSRGFSIPGGSGLNGPKMNGLFQRLSCQIGSRYFHNFPAPIAALRAIFKGNSCGSIDKGLDVESREFSVLPGLVETRNIIRSLFLNKGNFDRQLQRPDIAEKKVFERIYIDHEEIVKNFKADFEKAGFQITNELNKDTQVALIENQIEQSELGALLEGHPETLFFISNAQVFAELCADSNTLFKQFSDRVAGVRLSRAEKTVCFEISSGKCSTLDMIAATYDFAKQIRATAIEQDFNETWFSQHCSEALGQEINNLLNEGVTPALINNALKFSNFNYPHIADSDDGDISDSDVDFELLKNRLLSSVSSEAIKQITSSSISPEAADLISILSIGYPSWTGGAVSYIDSMGIDKFVERCSTWTETFGDSYELPKELQDVSNDFLYAKEYQ